MKEIAEVVTTEPKKEHVSQEQIHDLLFGERLSWRSIIYDLINTEQLDPWNIDLTVLANRYLEKVQELEEANFFVSSKVLLAASLLLRMKSDSILSKDLPTLDDVLFGRKSEDTKGKETIELDDEAHDLIPRTPLPRMRRVTLQELMTALGKAIKTENRRIKRHVISRQRDRALHEALPRKTFNLQKKIKEIYRKVKSMFKKEDEQLAFTKLIEASGEDKVEAFVTLLHLDTQHKLWLEQENHFEEIWIALKRKSLLA